MSKRFEVTHGAVVLTALLAFGCADEEGPKVSDPLTTDTVAMSTAQTAATPEVESGFAATAALEDNLVAISPGIPPGPVVFTVSNTGSMQHSLAIEGQGIERQMASPVDPGGTGTLEILLQPGTYTAYCAVLDHREREFVEFQVAE